MVDEDEEHAPVSTNGGLEATPEKLSPKSLVMKPAGGQSESYKLAVQSTSKKKKVLFNERLGEVAEDDNTYSGDEEEEEPLTD